MSLLQTFLINCAFGYLVDLACLTEVGGTGAVLWPVDRATVVGGGWCHMRLKAEQD